MNVNINFGGGGPPGPLGAMAKLIAGLLMSGILLFIVFWICIFGSIIVNTDPVRFFLYAFVAMLLGGIAIAAAKGDLK